MQQKGSFVALVLTLDNRIINSNFGCKAKLEIHERIQKITNDCESWVINSLDRAEKEGFFPAWQRMGWNNPWLEDGARLFMEGMAQGLS
jgi:hypothetical protein